MIQLPIKMPNLASFRESVDRSVCAENLRALASTTTEPIVLLGLSFLARSEDPVRKELADLAVRGKNEYAQVVAVLAVMMERIDAESVGELVRRDPDNALGHYLQGALLHVANRDNESLEAFRRAATCSELRCYESTTGEALFKAIDALGLQGLDRLCALSWAVSRWTNFSSAAFQPTYRAMSELAKAADTATRSELAEILLSLAGHLFATNFTNRFFALRAAEAAFILKAELPAAESPAKRQGYAAVVYGLVTPLFSWPGTKEWWNHGPLQLAQFLPGRIHNAFAAAEPSLINATYGESNLAVPESEREAMEAAKANASQAAKRLIEAALKDPDAIFGPYLKGLPQVERQAGCAPVFEWTPVESLLNKRPDLFQAAAANEEAMAALWRAGENAPSRKNVGQMMNIGLALLQYAQKHNQVYPKSLDVLFESGYLKPPPEVKSLRTGRPYLYVAAGERIPAKANDQAQFVLLYDDEPDPYGCFECVFASGTGGAFLGDDLKEQLRRRGKLSLASNTPS